MAISSATWVIGRMSIGGDRYIIKCSASVTGDGTGGAISASKDLSAYIPNGYIVSVLDASHQNNDNIARLWHVSTASADWESGGGSLAAGKQSDMLSDAIGTFISTPLHYTLPMPYYLGRVLSATPTIYVAGDTNTNTKNYWWQCRLLIQPPTGWNLQNWKTEKIPL